MSRWIFAAGVLVALGGCEQSPQALPFDVEASVTRTIGASGGTVSTAAGAAVHFDEGSIPGGTQVTLSTTQVPSAALRAGAPASGAFQLEPAGLTLSEPAQLELKFTPSTDPSRAWLASVVAVVDGNVREYGNSRVDLGTAVVSADIERLGTVLTVIPPAAAIFPLSPIPSRAQPATLPASALVLTDSVAVRCGTPENRCTGLSVSATKNLLDQVQNAALLYPVIQGALRIVGTSASGSLTANTSVRIQLQSGQTAESVEVNALLQPTAATVVTETPTEVRLTAVRHRISGSIDNETQAREFVGTLVIPRTGSSGTITVDRTFEVRTQGGGIEPARVTLTFPVTIYE